MIDSYEFKDIKKPLEDFDSGFLIEFRCLSLLGWIFLVEIFNEFRLNFLNKKEIEWIINFPKGELKICVPGMKSGRED